MNKRAKTAIVKITLLVFLCIFVWSAYNVYLYAKNYDALKQSYGEAQSFVQIDSYDHINEAPQENLENNNIYAENEDGVVNDQIEHIEDGAVDEYYNLKTDIVIDWTALSAKSKDLVGWVYIPDTTINYPIVQRENDNNYYLTRDYTGVYNPGGSIFLEKDATMDSQNVIIYGHRMDVDAMFHCLLYYTKQEFADAHKYIYIATENETRIYQVFSVVYTDCRSDTYTCDFNSGNKLGFAEYINKAIKNNVIAADTREITNNDKIISLSTCSGRSNDERMVVHAVLLAAYPNNIK